MDKPIRLLLLAASAAAFLAPVAIYIAHFGWNITADHERWGEMGAAMAGIYAPAVGLLTLYVLYRQLITSQQQAEFIEIQHLYQSSDARLNTVLENINQSLADAYARERLRLVNEITVMVRSSNGTGDRVSRNLASLWHVVYCCLEGFDNPKNVWLNHSYLSLQQKVVLRLGIANCHALDRLAYMEHVNVTFIFDRSLNNI